MRKRQSHRWISTVVVACFMGLQFVSVLPAAVRADTSQDLKTIEYKYYFRGNYEKAITELRSYLERSDLEQAQIVEAREYLAASLILTGKTEQGKSEYTDLLKLDGSYKGPNPSVFKSAIIATFEEARAEYASVVIRTVPDKVAADAASQAGTAPAEKTGKPFYKKWWFYATMGVVVLAIAGAAGGSDDGGSSPPQDRGTVTVEVDVP